MCFRQERVDLVAFGVVTDRVCAHFRLHRLDSLHRVGIENIDCARVPASNVEMFTTRIVEDHIRGSRQVRWMRSFPCMEVDCQQDSLIASAEEPSALHIDIESMRTRGGNVVACCNSIWVQANNRHYLWRVGNVDVETLGLLVEDSPSRSSRHQNIGSQNIFL